MNRHHRTAVYLTLGIAILTLFVKFGLSPPTVANNENEKEKDSVLIFTATTFFGLDMPSQKGSFIGKCPQRIQDYCRLTSNMEEFDKADAVLYHHPNYDPVVHVLPRNPNQVQVVLTMESPYYNVSKFPEGLINWTMTYRPDSDVYFPYGILKDKKQSIQTDLEAIWAAKNDNLTVAWMVTNCNAPSKRMELVKAAQKDGLNVDIFGLCGKKLGECDRNNENRYECAARQLRNYKFYLALENTNCHGYITEKFFHALRLYETVPIVLRRQYYKIPSNAYIAIDDFSTIKDFVIFLNKLASNKTDYLKYHSWRDYYDVVNTDVSTGFCLLCQKLKQPVQQTRNYVDLFNWFLKDMCENNYTDRFLL